MNIRLYACGLLNECSYCILASRVGWLQMASSVCCLPSENNALL